MSCPSRLIATNRLTIALTPLITHAWILRFVSPAGNRSLVQQSQNPALLRRTPLGGHARRSRAPGRPPGVDRFRKLHHPTGNGGSGFLPYPFKSGVDLLVQCKTHGLSIARVMMANEKAWRSESEIREGILHIWQVMQECVQNGIKNEGILPGGLKVKRRAAKRHASLMDINRQDMISAWLLSPAGLRNRWKTPPKLAWSITWVSPETPSAGWFRYPASNVMRSARPRQSTLPS